MGVASDVNDEGSSLMVTVVRVWEKDTEHGLGFPLPPVPPPLLRTPPPPELAVPLTEVTMTVAAVHEDFWTALFWF